MLEWIWEKTPDGTSRFVQGAVGENPLVCFGMAAADDPGHLGHAQKWKRKKGR